MVYTTGETASMTKVALIPEIPSGEDPSHRPGDGSRDIFERAQHMNWNAVLRSRSLKGRQGLLGDETALEIDLEGAMAADDENIERQDVRNKYLFVPPRVQDDEEGKRGDSVDRWIDMRAGVEVAKGAATTSDADGNDKKEEAADLPVEPKDIRSKLPEYASVATPVYSGHPPINQMLDRLFAASQEVDVTVKILDMLLLESAGLSAEYQNKGTHLSGNPLKNPGAGKQTNLLQSLQQQIMTKQDSKEKQEQGFRAGMTPGAKPQESKMQESPLTMASVGERQFAAHHNQLMNSFDTDLRTKLYNKHRKFMETGQYIEAASKKLEKVVSQSNERFSKGETDRAKYWDTLSDLNRYETYLEKLKMKTRTRHAGDEIEEEDDGKKNEELDVSETCTEPLLVMDEFDIWSELYYATDASHDSDGKRKRGQDSGSNSKRSSSNMTDREMMISRIVTSHVKNRLGLRTSFYKEVRKFVKSSSKTIPVTQFNYDNGTFSIVYFGGRRVLVGLSDSEIAGFNAAIGASGGSRSSSRKAGWIGASGKDGSESRPVVGRGTDGKVREVQPAFISGIGANNPSVTAATTSSGVSGSVIGSGMEMWAVDETSGQTLKTLHLKHIMSFLQNSVYQAALSMAAEHTT